MADLIITPSLGKIDFIHQSAQAPRVESIILHEEDGLVFTGKISASSVTAPLNVINVTAGSSNVNYPFIFASSGETGAKSLLMDSAGGTYNPSINTATIDISGNSATTTLASDSTNLGGVAAASYVTLTGTQTLTNKTITGTFTGNLTGTGSWATNAVSAVSATTATNSTQLNGQAASYYTNIPARLGYTPVNKIGDTISGDLVVNGNFTVNGSVTAFSASNIYLSSSVITVEDNILTLNAFSPYLRYAGIEMYDSGSGTLSQLLWDGDGDYFFLTGSSVNGKIITGPDGQTNLTSNYIPKATAGYKLGNSLIYDNGTNVGIGTTVPAYKLDVNGTFNVTGTSTLAGASVTGTINSSTTEVIRINNNNGYISFYNTAGTTRTGYLQGNTGNEMLLASENGAIIRFAIGGSERVRIDTNGNVGIGTTSPIFKFQVVGSAYVNNGTLYIDSGNSLTWGNSTQSILGTNDVGLSFTAGSATRMFISSSGNIGIGTTVPVARLQVNSTTAGATLLRTDGTNGTLFSVVDDLSDSLMSVNNSAGLPVLEVFADDRIVAGQYGQNDFVIVNNKVGIGTNNPLAELHVTSSTSIPSAVFLGGNVGIGTSSPAAKLVVIGETQISSNAAYTTHFNYQDTGIHFISMANGGYTDFRGSSNNITTMRVKGDGSVGIGTTIPSAPLHVVGVISGSSFTGAGTGLTGTASGLSIGGTATNITAYTINQNVGTGNTPSFAGIVSSAVTNYAFLQVTDTNNFWITPGNANWGLYFETTAGGLLGGTGDSNRLGFVGSGTARFYVDLNNGNGWFGGTLTAAGNISASNLSGTNTGDQTVGNGTITIAAGTGVGVGSTNTFTTNQSGATTVTISNSGVTSNVAGTGISLSGGTGAVTITNSGVTSAVAGTGVGVSAATGAVTFSIGQAVGPANTPSFASVTTSADGANITMAGTTNAEGIRMTPASSTTYPVFLRSVNPGVGEASPWIYKEQATDWGIWHNNPVNSIDFTKQGSGGIASNVGGSSSNTVTVRVEMATGYVQTIAGYRNSAGTTILSDAGNITGNAATVTTNANLTGDVTSTGNATTIASNAVTSVKIADSNVTLAKIVNISTGTILGNNGAGAAAPLALTSAQVAAMLSGQTMNIGGNAATATVLQTARNIGGVSFNGSADINLPGVNTAGNQNTSGTATTATTANALNTGNSYTGVNFTATGYLQSTVGYLRTDDSNGIEVLTTTNSAQAINVKGILIGSSYDTNPPQNEIRTSNNQSLVLNARGSGQVDIYTNDSTKVTVLNGGNVGVGTSNPGRKLDVEGIVRTRGASGSGGFEIGAATTGTAKWRIEWDSASDSLDFNWVG